MTLEQRNVRDYGIEDDDSLDTTAIQAALDDCAGGGDEMYLPPGTYRGAPFRVGDDTTFELTNGVELRFVQDSTEFPTVESRQEGWDQDDSRPYLHVTDASNITITGEDVIDGGGSYWQAFVSLPPEQYLSELTARLGEIRSGGQQNGVSIFTVHPPLFQIDSCKDVTVSGVTLRSSPFWNTRVVYSDDVTIHDVSIQDPPDTPSSGGIDIDSSCFIRVSDTHIDVGDDVICLKSGKDEQGREVGHPAENVVVTNCTVEHGHGGVIIGSRAAGDARRVTVTSYTFTNTDRGICIKSKRGRGGTVEDLRFDTVIMRRVACPFVINDYYQTDIDNDPKPVTKATPNVRDVGFHRITIEGVGSAASLTGLPEQRFEGISFTGVDIDVTRPFDASDLSPTMAKGYDQRHDVPCKSLGRVSLKDVRMTVPSGNGIPLIAETNSTVVLDGFEAEADEGSAVEAGGVENLRIGGCVAPDDGEPFARIRGKSDDESSVLLTGNYGDVDGAVVSVRPETVER